MKKSTIILVVIITVLLTSCQKDKSPKPKEKPDNETGIVTHDNLLVRKYPDAEFGKILTKLKKGDKVKLIKKTGFRDKIGEHYDLWYNIKLKTGLAGWAYGAFIKINDYKVVPTEYHKIFPQEFYIKYLKNINPDTIKRICNYNKKLKVLELEELYKQGQTDEIIKKCEKLLSVPPKFFKYWLVSKKFRTPIAGSGDLKEYYKFKKNNSFFIELHAWGAGEVHEITSGTYKINNNNLILYFKKKIETKTHFRTNKLIKTIKKLNKILKLSLIKIPYDYFPDFLPYHSGNYGKYDLSRFIVDLKGRTLKFFIKSFYTVYKEHTQGIYSEGFYERKKTSLIHKKAILKLLQATGMEVLILSNGYWPHVK